MIDESVFRRMKIKIKLIKCAGNIIEMNERRNE